MSHTRVSGVSLRGPFHAAALIILSSAVCTDLWAEVFPDCPTINFGVPTHYLLILLSGQSRFIVTEVSPLGLRVSEPGGSVSFYDDPRNEVLFDYGPDQSGRYYGGRRTPSGAWMYRNFQPMRDPTIDATAYSEEQYLLDQQGADPLPTGRYDIFAGGGGQSFQQNFSYAYIIPDTSRSAADPCIGYVPGDSGWYGFFWDNPFQTPFTTPFSRTFLIGTPSDKALAVFSGGDQVGIVGQALPEPLTVRVTQDGQPKNGVNVAFAVSSAPVTATPATLSPATAQTAGGQASTVLTLGDVPAEYQVTATCPDCAPGKSTATFTCCGKLATTDYKQSASPWGTQTYDSTTGTIGQWGCALTAMANLINFYAQTDVGISTETPGSLNVAMTALGSDGFQPVGRIVWGGLSLVTTGKIDVVAYSLLNAPTPLEELIVSVRDDILQKKPVIVGVSGEGFQSHFMLVLGLCGEKLVVGDPSFSGRVLYDPRDLNELLVTVVRFRRNP